eukprot:13120488-Ditylum_brightwellii.AAC.1
MSKYFGQPPRLRKALYGLTLSGKLWVIEFSEWLLNQGFIQSNTEPACFILYKDEKTWLILIFYVDDMLCFGSKKQIEKYLEKLIKSRFHHEIQGNAHWFLQMKIHQHKDGSYSLDQTSYPSNIIHKYNPKTCSWGLPQHGTT